jgi:hypothetical protein
MQGCFTQDNFQININKHLIYLLEQLCTVLANARILNQLWHTFLIVFSIVIIARTFVARSRYFPIFIIVVFGLIMGLILVQTEWFCPTCISIRPFALYFLSLLRKGYLEYKVRV